VHRRVAEIAQRQDWVVSSYATVHAVTREIDRAMSTLTLEGSTRYHQEVYDSICRREASGPNHSWQADHTELDLWVLTAAGKPARPWLSVVEDDYSRAIAGDAVNLGAPFSAADRAGAAAGDPAQE
jgi:putative transposase